MSVRNTVKTIQDIMRQDAGVDGDAQRISQLCWMFFLKILDDQDQQLELMQRRLPLAAAGAAALARLGCGPRRDDRRELLTSSTTSCSRAQGTVGRRASRATAAASCATSSRTPTTT